MPNDSVLDVGCGWGRLAYLLPTTWRGDYLGIDITPEFLSITQQNHPDLDFAQCDVSNVSQFMEEYKQRSHVESEKWNWAVCVSIKGMVCNNLTETAWDYMLTEMKAVAERVLVLEYDENDKGEIL